MQILSDEVLLIVSQLFRRGQKSYLAKNVSYYAMQVMESFKIGLDSTANRVWKIMPVFLMQRFVEQRQLLLCYT